MSLQNDFSKYCKDRYLEEYPRISHILYKSLKENRQNKALKKNGRIVVLHGARGVGKSIIAKVVTTAISDCSRKSPEEPIRYIPLYVTCQDDLDIMEYLMLLLPNYSFTIRGSSNEKEFRKTTRAIIVVDDSHRCKGIEKLIEWSYKNKAIGAVLLIAPYQKPIQRRTTKSIRLPESIIMYPARFVEVYEILCREFRNFIKDNDLLLPDKRRNFIKFIIGGYDDNKYENKYKLLINFYNEHVNKDDNCNPKLIFHKYAIYGGTIAGIDKSRDNIEIDTVYIKKLIRNSHFYDKLIHEIIDDFEIIKNKDESILMRAVLWQIAELIFEKSLRTTIEELHNGVMEKLHLAMVPSTEKRSIERALFHLRDAGLIIQAGRQKQSSDKPQYKFAFIDPRYAIGAALDFYTYIGDENRFESLVDIVTFKSEKSGHYLESLVLSNVALGVYSLIFATFGKQGRHTDLSRLVKWGGEGENEYDVIVELRDFQLKIEVKKGKKEKCVEAKKRENINDVIICLSLAEDEVDEERKIFPVDFFLLLI